MQRALFFSTGTERFLKNLNLDDCFIFLRNAWESLDKPTLHKVWRSILGNSLNNDQNRSATISYGNSLESSTIPVNAELSNLLQKNNDDNHSDDFNDNNLQSASTPAGEEPLHFLRHYGDQIIKIFPKSQFSVDESRQHLSDWLNEVENDYCG